MCISLLFLQQNAFPSQFHSDAYCDLSQKHHLTSTQYIFILCLQFSFFFQLIFRPLKSLTFSCVTLDNSFHMAFAWKFYFDFLRTNLMRHRRSSNAGLRLIKRSCFFLVFFAPKTLFPRNEYNFGAQQTDRRHLTSGKWSERK